MKTNALSTEELRELIHLTNRIQIDMVGMIPHSEPKAEQAWLELMRREGVV